MPKITTTRCTILKYNRSRSSEPGAVVGRLPQGRRWAASWLSKRLETLSSLPVERSSNHSVSSNMHAYLEPLVLTDVDAALCMTLEFDLAYCLSAVKRTTCVRCLSVRPTTPYNDPLALTRPCRLMLAIARTSW